MEVNQYLSMFIDESKEHLQSINDQLLNLEQNPSELGIVQTIFRSAHTLKGMSATMGFEDLASLTHQMENVLDLVRNQKLAMDAFIFDALFRSTDSLESMVQDIIGGGSGKADVSDIVAVLKSIVSGEYAKPGTASTAPAASAAQPANQIDEFQYSVLDQSISSGYQVYYVEVKVRDDCVLKAARAYMVFTVFDSHGEVIKSTPTVEEIEQEKFDRVFSVYYVTQIGQKELHDLVADVSEIESVQVTPLDQETLKQILIRQKQEKPAPATPVQAAPGPASTAPEAAGKPAAAAGTVSRTIRVDIERLDAVMNLFSELLIDRVRLEQLASEIHRPELTETVEHMSRVSSDLQNIVMKLRMVPVDTVFNRFPRMIRDVARTLDKKLELIITGADTELDRTVVDEIGDPLVHLLRNAADHGIESVADRIAAGKPETGSIYLRAYHSGNHIFIEVEEDGRGINRDGVLRKAIQNGVLTAEQAAKLSDQDVYQLIFASGFSTAEKISDLSGRGVGLDVVKTKIESLGGQVFVDSKPGAGTRFSVQLPLTLSIIAAMLVRIGEEKYAIPLSSIVETASVPRKEIRRVHGMAMVDYRSGVIPLISLRELLHIPGEPSDGPDADMIIVRKGEKLAAVAVDEFIGQQEIVLKPLGKYLSNLFAISGATILGDGQVALILDTNALIKA